MMFGVEKSNAKLITFLVRYCKTFAQVGIVRIFKQH
jgi:hypothetical protein